MVEKDRARRVTGIDLREVSHAEMRQLRVRHGDAGD